MAVFTPQPPKCIEYYNREHLFWGSRTIPRKYVSSRYTVHFYIGESKKSKQAWWFQATNYTHHSLCNSRSSFTRELVSSIPRQSLTPHCMIASWWSNTRDRVHAPMTICVWKVIKSHPSTTDRLRDTLGVGTLHTVFLLITRPFSSGTQVEQEKKKFFGAYIIHNA